MNLGASSPSNVCDKADPFGTGRPLRPADPQLYCACSAPRAGAGTFEIPALSTSTTDSRALLEHPSFVRFWIARLTGGFAQQMQAVAVGWQMYALTGSALDLGLVGLVQFAPSVLLLLVVGHVADRCDRRWILSVCQV